MKNEDLIKKLMLLPMDAEVVTKDPNDFDGSLKQPYIAVGVVRANKKSEYVPNAIKRRTGSFKVSKGPVIVID